MNSPTQCPRCEQLCEELSHQVSDQLDPSVNVPWMRGSPDLPKYVQGLEAKCAEMRAAISRALCVGLHEGHLISHEKKAEACRQQLEHALSSDCGKDYVPRSELNAAKAEVEMLRQLCQRLHSWLTDGAHFPFSLANDLMEALAQKEEK